MVSVAKAMVECLVQEGVTTVFGIPGATICPFFDALYESNINTVLMRHEQSTGHAANGYARVSNKVGVCIATSGPGALNLLTAVATAYMDSVALVVITGQVSSEVLGRDVFQEADITGAAEPFVKHSYLIKSKDEAQDVLRQAFHIASTGRKGPVLIDIPVDIQQELVELKPKQEIVIRSYNPNVMGHRGQIKKLISAINISEKPLICVGGGVFTASAEGVLRELIDKCKIPVVSTMMGISAVSPMSPMYIGMVGMYGCDNANSAVHESDLLLLVGARVGDRAIMSPIGLSEHTVIAHLDIDPAEIGKNIRTHIPIVGDAKDILSELVTRLDCSDKSYLAEKHAKTNAIEGDMGEKICPTSFIKALMDILPRDSVVVADVGQNQIYTAKGYSLAEGRFMTSGGMGTMGYALPAAIGASFYDNRREVVAICGDGGFQMSLMELATLGEQDVAVKIVVMNNSSLGLVRELQHRKYGGREIAVRFSNNPNFCGLGEAYGMQTCCISKASEIEAGITEMLACKGSFLLEVVID